MKLKKKIIKPKVRAANKPNKVHKDKKKYDRKTEKREIDKIWRAM
jgi:hypothetical protein